MPVVTSDRQQFSIVSNFISHRNDIKMFKTQVETWAACEWFNCKVFLTFHLFVRTLIFPLKFFFENCAALRRKTNCATIRSFLVVTLVKLSSWPISAWKLTQFMVKCYIFPFYSLHSFFLVLWVFCFLHCLMIPVPHTCQCMSSLVYLFLHLLLEPFSWESMKNFSSPSKSPSLFLLNLLFNLHSCTGAKLNAAWENICHLVMLPLVSPPNDVWETSAEIPYWWCVITQIWVVLLIGRSAWEIYFSESEALPRSG